MTLKISLETHPVEGAEKETCENGVDAFVQPPGWPLAEEPDTKNKCTFQSNFLFLITQSGIFLYKLDIIQSDYLMLPVSCLHHVGVSTSP